MQQIISLSFQVDAPTWSSTCSKAVNPLSNDNCWLPGPNYQCGFRWLTGSHRKDSYIQYLLILSAHFLLGLTLDAPDGTSMQVYGSSERFAWCGCFFGDLFCYSSPLWISVRCDPPARNSPQMLVESFNSLSLHWLQWIRSFESYNLHILVGISLFTQIWGSLEMAAWWRTDYCRLSAVSHPWLTDEAVKM